MGRGERESGIGMSSRAAIKRAKRAAPSVRHGSSASTSASRPLPSEQRSAAQPSPPPPPSYRYISHLNTSQDNSARLGSDQTAWCAATAGVADATVATEAAAAAERPHRGPAAGAAEAGDAAHAVRTATPAKRHRNRRIATGRAHAPQTNTVRNLDTKDGRLHHQHSTNTAHSGRQA